MKKTGKGIRQQVERMLGWATGHQTRSAAGKPFLQERDGILALHFDGVSVQSEMSIDQPDELLLSYTRAMMSFLLLAPAPGSLAMIGLGGGSLAKYCYRYLPQTDITVVEINPDVIALRNEFAIPADDARFKVLQGDGAAFVADAASQFDALVVDGFDADGLPAELSSQRFYDDCFASLADGGVMAVNLWASYPHYGTCLARIRRSFADCVAVVDEEEGLNKIVLAMKNAGTFPSASAIRHHAKLMGSAHPLNFQAKSNRLIQALPLPGSRQTGDESRSLHEIG
ncbi:MAG TPA: transferase [Gallionella sp.]|nr:transferase [Gallionella sp.]